MCQKRKKNVIRETVLYVRRLLSTLCTPCTAIRIPGSRKSLTPPPTIVAILIQASDSIFLRVDIYITHRRVAMLSLFKASSAYIIAEQTMLGVDHPGLAASQTARVQHFRESITSFPQDVEDSQSVMQALQVASTLPNAAFSPSHLREIASAVSLHMTVKTANVASTAGNAKPQVNLYVFNYMPLSLWSKLGDAQISWEAKLELFVDFLLHVLRLRNPTDATLKVCLSICKLLHQRTLPPNEAYNEIQKLKTKLFNKRLLHPGDQSLLEFQSDPAAFITLYPSAYPECDPPVASKLDEMNIREGVRKDVMPTRSNNRVLGKSTPVGSPPRGDAESAMVQMAMQYMMGRAPLVDNVEWRKDTPRKPKAPLALEDGPTDAVAEIVTVVPKPLASSSSTGKVASSTLQEIIDKAKDAICKHKTKAGRKDSKNKSKKKKKTEKKLTASTESSSESVSDAEAPKTKKTAKKAKEVKEVKEVKEAKEVKEVKESAAVLLKRPSSVLTKHAKVAFSNEASRSQYLVRIPGQPSVKFGYTNAKSKAKALESAKAACRAASKKHGFALPATLLAEP